MPLLNRTSIEHCTTKPFICQVALLIGLAGLLLAGLATTIWLDNAHNYGVAWGPDLPRIPLSDVPPLGVNLFLDREPDEATMRRTLERAHDMGARWVKQLFPWEQIEPTAKGNFRDERFGGSTWAHYDRIVRLAQETGLELIVRLDRPPDWARQQALAQPALQAALEQDPDREITGPPDDLDDYGDFVYAVVSRYQGQVGYVQLWNEPNLANEWNWAPIDPARFVELLCLGYRRAKEANPDVVVLFPSLAPNDGLDPRHMSDLAFLQQVYESGGRACFDVMSAQLYGLGQPPTERTPLGFDRDNLRLLTRTDVSRVVLLREIMERYDDRDKAIWVGELGWNATPAGWTGQPSPWGRPVDEQTKGRYIVQALDRSLREWPWMGVHNLWFLHWDGPPPEPDDPTPFFALLDYDFAPLPAYRAVQTWARTRPQWGVGYHDLAGSTQVACAFVGTRLDLLLPAGVDPQSLTARVDGQPQSMRFWRDEGAEVRYIAVENLPDGLHTVQIEGPPGSLRAAYVVRERPLPWLFPTLTALLSLGLVATVALLMVRLPGALAAVWAWAWQRWEHFGKRSPWGQGATVLGGMALALGLLYFVDLLPLSLVALLVLGLLAWLRLDLALAVAVFVIPLYPRPATLAGRHFSLFELTILACLGAAGLHLLRRLQQRTPLPRFRLAQLLPALAFLAVAFGSLFWATDHAFLTDEGTSLLRISLREFRVTVVEPFLLYPLLVLALPTRSMGAPAGSRAREGQLAERQALQGRVWWMVDALVLSGVLAAVGGIIQVLDPSQHAEVAEGVRRASSIYGTFSPNELALFLGRVLALAVPAALFLPRGRRKWLYGAALVPLGLAFLLTYSRGGYIALALVLLFYGLVHSRLLLWVEVAAGLAGALLAWLTGAIDRLLATDTFSNRLTMWRNSWTLIRERPGVGLGLDAFYHHYLRRYPELGDEAFWTPHNVVLEFWTRLGLLGLAAGAWLYGAFFFRAGRLYRRLDDPARRLLVLGLLGSIVYALAHGLLDGTFFAPDWAATFWLAYGLVALPFK